MATSDEIIQSGDFYWLETGDKAKLRYAVWADDSDRATILLVQGRSEFIEKYAEVVSELRSRRLRVIALDLRGQGLSGRLVEGTDKGHITDFAVYARDLVDLLREVADDIQGPLIGMGHSMGGHILIRHLCQGGKEFTGIVTMAPMVGLDVPAVPDGVLRAFVEGAHLLGRDEDYMPGASGFDPLNREFDGNKLTSDKNRFDAARQIMRENPELALGGATIGWLKAALRSCALITEPSLLSRIDTPLMVASARADTVVDPLAHDHLDAFCPMAELVSIEGAKHEILFEQDSMRNQFWESADRFIDALVEN